MKKRARQIIEGIIISLTTLVIGGAVTGVTFNLFDTLTRTQVRILFVLDIAIMLAIGTGALIIYESRESKKYKDRMFQERHNKRVEEEEKRMKGIESIISFSNYAA